MSFLGFFRKGALVIIDTVALPVEMVKDVVTLGGAVTGGTSATVERAKKICKHIENAYDELDE